MTNKPIFVTQPSLPPLNEFVELLEGVWESGILTHNGPLVQEFERSICTKLNIDHFTAVTNGTVALQMAIKALELKGEIITTPFSWIATVSAIKWEECKPVFCDIDPYTFNIDANKIEECITEKTVAIMPVHVFGNPCDVDAIEIIAKKYNLKVIYDAAHAIGSTYKGKSLLAYGDISATSLHSTKLLNTGEGGGCVTRKSNLQEKLNRIRFFGYDNNKEIAEDGFNGKMTEIHAALGLANLNYFDGVLEDRKEKYHIYKNEISQNSGLKFQEIKYGEVNHSYFPVVFETEEQLLAVEKALNNKNYFPRRYFYPSLNTFKYVVKYDAMPMSESIASRILCFPLYLKLKHHEIHKIIEIINDNI